MAELFEDIGSHDHLEDVEAVGQGMTFYPTLLIGLGGTGAEVLLRVKRMLGQRLAEAQSLHRFLFIDTDLRTYSNQPGMPSIEPRESCIVGFHQVKTLLENPKQHPGIWDRFPPEKLEESYIRNLGAGIGAGQVRSLGALALALDYPKVRQQMSDAFNELISIPKTAGTKLAQAGAAIGSNVVVYIVGSLSGGTGSGCFLDVALLAKDVCEARDPSVVGMFALPNSLYDAAAKHDQYQMDRMRANGYAALKELQFVLDTEDRNQQIQYDYGSGNRLDLDPSDQVFRLLYLVDDHNALGGLPKIEELYSLMARSVYQDVGSPFGANARSFESNNQAVSGVQSCPVTKRKRILGTTATSSLVYPAQRVAKYATYRLLSGVLDDHLLGPTPVASAIEGLATAFLNRECLDDRGRNNQIQEDLLKDSRTGEVMSSDVFGVPQSFADDADPRDFVEKIQQHWRNFVNSDLPGVRKTVTEHLKRRLGGDQNPPRDLLRESVTKLSLEVAEKNNAASVERVLEKLEEVVTNMRSELESELTQWSVRDGAALEQDFNDQCDKLIRVKLPFLSKRDETLKRSLINLFNDRVDGALSAAAKPHAIDFLDALGGRLREAIAQWRSLNSDLVQLRKEAVDHRKRLETHNRSRQGHLAFEQEITQPGYEQDYYKANELSTKDALARIEMEFGDRRVMYASLIDMAGPDRIASMGRRLGGVVYALVSPPLLKTNIVDFVSEHPEEVDRQLDTKLDLMFLMCQPFWDIRPVRTSMGFPEFLGLTVKHRKDEKGSLQAPSVVKAWLGQNAPSGRGGSYETIHTDVPYEITLGRRTYGARAFYLTAADQWKVKYELEAKNAEGRFMIATHASLLNAPDLFPVDTEAIDGFALGLAFGFIATRGDWYYFNLERSDDKIRVLFTSQWQTIPVPDVGTPPTFGAVRFECLERQRLQSELRLAQGREAAAEAMEKRGDWTALVHEAVEEYHGAVGNDALRNQLSAYVRDVLEPRLGTTDVYKREKAAIGKRLIAIGK